MTVFFVDISGKVLGYDIFLCESIQMCEDNDVELSFFSPIYDEKPHCKTTRLVNLVPHKYKSIGALWKRIIKALELVINYIYFLYRVKRQKPDIIHFQWFPLLEFCDGEELVVRLIKKISDKTRIVLTIHNVYPHNMSDENKRKYAKRFKRIEKLIDVFIVHTCETKQEVKSEFGINDDKIVVIHHGILSPKHFTPNKHINRGEEMTFIMFGNLSDYKGVDVFIEAICLLPDSYQSKVRCIIAGEMQDKVLCKKLQEKSRSYNVDWYPHYMEEQVLYEMIDKSDVIVLPYKRISQSGVLLLALSFKRLILTSDLPAFKETLHGFSEDMFFKSENAQSLTDLMIKYIDGKIDINKQMATIEDLNRLYAWDVSAKATIKLYDSLFNTLT